MDVQDIMDALDLHGFEDIEDADKVAVINDVLQEINSRDPWPYLEVMVDFDAATDVDADGKVTLPGSPPVVGSVLDIVNLDRSTYGKVQWIRRDEHFARNPGNLDQTGHPYKYFFVGSDLYLWPIPDSGNYRITYLQVQEDVDASSTADDILLPARHHRVILLGAAYKLHSQEDDPENATMFKSQYDERIIMMRQDLFTQQWDKPDSILMTDDEDFGYE